MAAGIVTASDAEFEEILQGRDEAVRAIARAARALLFSVLPEAVEVVWLQQRGSGYGIGARKMTEHFAWLLPQRAHVTLALPRGADLPDPAGLLQGTGARIRNVRLVAPADLEAPELRELLAASLALVRAGG